MKLRTLFLALTIVFAPAARSHPLAPLPQQPSNTPWPTESWPTGPLPDAIDRQLADLLDVVGRTDPEMKDTREVVIIWRGRLVAERYARNFGPDVRLISWSMAKSITQSLVGIAVRRGLVNIDQPLSYPAWPVDDPRGRVTWRQWLNMVDGMEFHEIGAKGVEEDDSANMLYGAGRSDIAAFAATFPIARPAGAYWNYNTAGIDLVANALGRLLIAGKSDPNSRRAAMLNFMSKELFLPIGMHSAQPEFDPAGNFVGGSLVYATARDFAKFGYLYLRNGVWDGRRILPDGWVDFARRKTPADNCDIYGAGWWVVPSRGTGKPISSLFPNTLSDVFFARGHEGQLIVVVPSRDLVLVRLGVTPRDAGPGGPAIGRWATNIINLFPAR